MKYQDFSSDENLVYPVKTEYFLNPQQQQKKENGRFKNIWIWYAQGLIDIEKQ